MSTRHSPPRHSLPRPSLQAHRVEESSLMAIKLRRAGRWKDRFGCSTNFLRTVTLARRVKDGDSVFYQIYQARYRCRMYNKVTAEKQPSWTIKQLSNSVHVRVLSTESVCSVLHNTRLGLLTLSSNYDAIAMTDVVELDWHRGSSSSPYSQGWPIVSIVISSHLPQLFSRPNYAHSSSKPFSGKTVSLLIYHAK